MLGALRGAQARVPLVHDLSIWFDQLRPCLRAASNAAKHATPQSSELTVTKRVTLDVPLSTGRARLCVLGTGWAAARLLRDIDSKLFDFVVRLRHATFSRAS